jgi:nitrate reductase NapE component
LNNFESLRFCEGIFVYTDSNPFETPSGDTHMSKITTKSERTWANFIVMALIIITPIALVGGAGFKSMSPQAQYDTISVFKEIFSPTVENPSKSDKTLTEDILYWTNSPDYWELQEARSQQRAAELAASPEKQKELEDMLAKMARKD